MRIINVVGARPNFMKIAPIVAAMNHYPEAIEHKLVHTGQHYDRNMSDAFFEELALPAPDVSLGVGSGSHAQQTARVMLAFEEVCLAERPDVVLVVGDVNSTLACALTAKKLGIQVAHVEAGLRSRDMSMPEEINRLCTDAVADYLFTTDHLADQNLYAEGVSCERVVRVGNVMIDTLLCHLEASSTCTLLEELALRPGEYAVLTLHRPANVDDPGTLGEILGAVHDLSEALPVVFPAHPRARARIAEFGFGEALARQQRERRLLMLDPLGYLAFLHLTRNAKLLLTDSGGLQEESTVLGVPCLTLRDNTERPITCEIGTNILVGRSRAAIGRAAGEILGGQRPKGRIPELWDGRAAERIVDFLRNVSAGA